VTNLEASQPVPAWPSFLRPILEVLSDGQGWKTGDLKPAAVARLKLSEMQRTQILKSGQSQADNRAGWALSALTRAKAVEKVQIGESRITDFGLQMLVDHPAEITEADVKAVPAYQEYVPTKPAQKSVTVDAEDLPSYWFVGAYFDEIVVICKRCVTEPDPQLWLCPACARIHSPTRREAREHGRLMFTRGMLVGSDDFHTVVVEYSKNRWERQQDGAPSQPVANPAVTAFLDGRLASGAAATETMDRG